MVWGWPGKPKRLKEAILSDVEWSENPGAGHEHGDAWKERYAHVDPAHAEALGRAGEQRRIAQAGVKTEGRARTS
jgi:hypothetical protein